MEGYLGETEVKQEDTRFKEFTPSDWALYFITFYGGFDGAHHKDWVLDQVTRVLKGTPVIIKLAKWKGGYEEHCISTGEPSKEYLEFIQNTDYWSEGIAPQLAMGL